MTALTTKVDRPAGRATTATPLPVGLLRWLPALATVAFVLGFLLWIDTPPAALAKFCLYTLWGLVVPGTLCYRLLRRTPHTLVEDLAVGTALGYVLELVAWSLFSALDLRAWLWMWPLAVVVPFAAVPRLRRHWRPSGYQAVPLAWSWVVALSVAALVGYLGMAFLRVNPPVVTSGTHLYFLDQMYLLSLVGEAKQHFPMHSPQAALDPLAYHWFTYAHEAASSLITGIDTPIVHFRLFLPPAAALSVVLLAVLGWRLSGRPWVGAVATALMFAIGELAVGSFAATSTPGVTAYITWSSNSVSYGWLYMFPLIIMIADRLAPAAGVPAVGAAAWPLMIVFALGATGAKSSILPIVLCGLGLAALVSLLRKRFDRPVWLALAICLGAQLVGMAVIYRFGAYGVILEPLVIFGSIVHSAEGRPWWQDAVVIGFVAACYVTYMFARLAAIPVWVRAARRPWTATEWLLIGGVIGGLCGTLLLYQPALSQNYFLRTAFPLGAILSALGYVMLVERVRPGLRAMTAMVSASVVVAFAVTYALWKAGADAGGPGFHALMPMARAAAAFGAIAVLAWLAGRIWSRRTGRHAGIGAVAGLTVILLAGAPTFAWDAYQYPNQGNWFHDEVGAEKAAALRWLRDNSSPDDIVATNRHHHPQMKAASTFYLAAFSERRFLVESWGYVPRSVAEAGELGYGQGWAPFWDPDLLARNDAMFTTPTAEGAAWLRGHGVRWLVADTAAGPVSPSLAEFATARANAGTLTVYELRG